jgi:hypothetical protein
MDHRRPMGRLRSTPWSMVENSSGVTNRQDLEDEGCRCFNPAWHFEETDSADDLIMWLLVGRGDIRRLGGLGGRAIGRGLSGFGSD